MVNVKEQKAIRDYRRAHGLCYDCGKMLPKGHEHIMCPVCFEKQKKRYKKRKEKALKNGIVNPKIGVGKMEIKRWTENEIEFLRENRSNMTSKQLAEKLKRGIPAVEKRMHALGIRKFKDVAEKKKAGRPKGSKNRNNQRWTEDEIEFLRENRPKMKTKELAKSLGRGIEATKFKLTEYNIRIWKHGKGKIKYNHPKQEEEEIIINVPTILKREGNNIICSNISQVVTIMGTSSVIGNQSLYGIRQNLGKEFIVPIESIQKRIKAVEEKLEATKKHLAIMKQIV